MAAPGPAYPAARATLRAGTGGPVRRELRLRSVAAAVLAVPYLAAAVYGGYGVARTDDIGVPFLVFGVAGALALLVLCLALHTARRAIPDDTYDKPAITRARRTVGGVLILLGVAAVIALIAGTVTLGPGLAGLTILGLAACFAAIADSWRVLRYLG